ncbi:hypothetical protein EXIGLDRAFT_237779 [Exidia glandulosa HHB12029]|uniref:Secreted protein n=1 Tax=Exidia glandulosa HHB12029 TaxID=1314781 RepID=A0A165E003_EXIGL|nr:hypothetical protein EXIGLDRAFT_237779 [Exidia glandulosa HHB12029]
MSKTSLCCLTRGLCALQLMLSLPAGAVDSKMLFALRHAKGHQHLSPSTPRSLHCVPCRNFLLCPRFFHISHFTYRFILSALSPNPSLSASYLEVCT